MAWPTSLRLMLRMFTGWCADYIFFKFGRSGRWLVSAGLQQGDGKSSGADSMSDEYRAEVFVDAHLDLAQIRLGREGGRIQLFERLGDAFGLCAREASLFEFLDEAIGVDDQCLHRPSVYRPSVFLQTRRGYRTASSRTLDGQEGTDNGVAAAATDIGVAAAATSLK
jgi:hypothetical protein